MRLTFLILLPLLFAILGAMADFRILKEDNLFPKAVMDKNAEKMNLSTSPKAAIQSTTKKPRKRIQVLKPDQHGNCPQGYRQGRRKMCRKVIHGF